MQCNLIQLDNSVTITVDNEQFEKVRKKYRSIFCRHIVVKDTRGYEFEFKKKQIVVLEKSNEE